MFLKQVEDWIRTAIYSQDMALQDRRRQVRRQLRERRSEPRMHCSERRSGRERRQIT